MGGGPVCPSGTEAGKGALVSSTGAGCPAAAGGIRGSAGVVALVAGGRGRSDVAAGSFSFFRSRGNRERERGRKIGACSRAAALVGPDARRLHGGAQHPLG